MAGSGRPDDNYAVRHAEEYKPVTRTGDQCVSVKASGGKGILLCHASRPLDMAHPEVSRLLIVVHGALRNAADYLEHAERAAELAQVSARTISVAPQFLADVDMQPGLRIPEECLFWDVDEWKSGQQALGAVAASSFTAMDCLVRHLVRSTWPQDYPVPEKRTVVIVGNSAGGQFVNRYAIVGKEPERLARDGIHACFIIANPSSYLYFSMKRPMAVAGIPAVNRWRYGFDDPPEYVDKNPRQYLEQYLGRDVSIVLGAEDRDPAALLLEVSPPAMAQGANRLERGVYYYEHIQEMAREADLPSRHQLVRLQGVGHDAREVITSPQAIGLMFQR
jgi:hypothetical protein